ncbi:DNA uptake protein-related DNA-binding protein [Corynebacterium humireducens NBRC 106098 = DSM 45392]|uniref:DNA uptake protein-related DNA-binding protein n=1 Tax=Corynebacterium humireducens NBRC 106098 = DSM 45392 TaxID=1223515 RepID=A0A0B5D4C7_9CORY|nr:ComEA family DNA-binding protein [Corynebacterium humireducens]AJE33835.1 DNA uptake protein-related DNA-binding protein [Corynebacterium humireducens NBRC 106098 = DSM 45392]
MSPLDRLKDLTRPTGQEDLLDVAYPTPRLHLSVRHAVLAALSVVVVVGVLLVAQSRTPEPVAFEAPAVEAPPADQEELVVSVVGAVVEPGLLTLAPGARVHDALQQVSPLPDADLTALNLAQKLTDGQQLVVPVVGVTPAEASSGISLNSATESELTALPGVGPATAAAIVAHRESTGGFGSVEQLLDVRGIGPAKFESLRDQVTL